MDRHPPTRKAQGLRLRDLPADLMGPTGLVYVGSTGIQTEMMQTYVVDGQYCNIPLLIPSQEDVGSLLAGYPPTQRQVDRAIAWMKRQPSWPKYSTIQEARAALQDRQARIESELIPLIEAHLRTKYAGVLR